MPERRFNEDEVAAIFERASSAQPADARALQRTDGMTLAELQDIGREVGIPPEQISRAAAAIDQSGTVTSRKVLGLPIGVGRIVELPRKLTDDEWERLVVDLRETFDARGVMRAEGSMRHWANGNLQVLLEPSATGQRIRFRTLKGNAVAAMAMGAGIVALAAFGLVVEIAQAGAFEARDAVRMGAFAAVGLGAIAAWAASIPAWARTRRAQMEAIGTRLINRLTE
jgi:hypothetical protein